MNVTYKLITKVSSFRLNAILPSTIPENQHAFICNRSIQTCSMLAFELVHTINARKDRALLLNFDFQKAFDNVSWDFLRELMENMGFDFKWIQWVHNCLLTSQVSIHVNGNPCKPFIMEKGVRKGDPLVSPCFKFFTWLTFYGRVPT